MLLSIFIGVTELYMVYYNDDAIKHFNQQSTLQTLFDYRFISSILWYPASDPVSNGNIILIIILSLSLSLSAPPFSPPPLSPSVPLSLSLSLSLSSDCYQAH